MSKKLPFAVAALCLLGQGAAMAHHSFAVFFDDKKQVKIHGAVTSFRFTNPHATIVLNATDGVSPTREWRVETNAPVVLQRRGWGRDSLKAGDVVTIDGWPSRDGKPYIRLRQATDAQGKPIGQSAFGTTDS
ncbi:MAG: hypothetical protein RLZZ08_1859 [Pseudomonadota bacterium]